MKEDKRISKGSRAKGKLTLAEARIHFLQKIVSFRQIEKAPDSERAFQHASMRNTLRFFALMLVLTLIARGTAGATMPVVTLQDPVSGVIVQSIEVDGTVQGEGGQVVTLPNSLTVESISAQKGESVQAGDVIATFSITDLQTQLRQKKAELEKQQALLSSLSTAASVDGHGVEEAQTALARVQEDDNRERARQQLLVNQAQTQLENAQNAQTLAEQSLAALLLQNDPAPDEAEIAAARQLVADTTAATETAQNELNAANQTMDAALLETSRSIENAQAALEQAKSGYEKEQVSAAITAQGNHADATLVQIEMDALNEEIAQLSTLLQQDGQLRSSCNAEVLECAFVVGQKTDATSNTLRLTDSDSRALVVFDLSQEKADLLTIGQSVIATRGDTTATASVRKIDYSGDADSTSAHITALLPQESINDWSVQQQVKIQIVFSKNEYAQCLPVSAVRQDSTGHYVLTVEQKQTALGIVNTAVRNPVTILEVSSDGATVAVVGAFAGKVIVTSDRTVQDGSSVRIKE